MSNPGIDVLFRVKEVVCAIPSRRRGNQLHQPARAFARNRSRIPVRFRLDHCANQRRVHVMPLRSLADQFFRAVPVNAQPRPRIACKRRFAWKIDRRGLLPLRFHQCRGSLVHKQPAAALVGNRSNLRRCRLRTQSQRCQQDARWREAGRDCHRFFHRSLGEGTHRPGTFTRSGHALEERKCLPPDTPLAPRPYYNRAPGKDGMLAKALFRPVVSVPPPSAKSGLPPPFPPSFVASPWISLPAWTLLVRSLVTPAISATLPSSGMPSATIPEPSFCRSESTSCRSPSRSTWATSAATTFTPLITWAFAASSSSWLRAPLRFCVSSSFSNCFTVCDIFSTVASTESSATFSWCATCVSTSACF